MLPCKNFTTYIYGLMVFIQILQNWNISYTVEVAQNAPTIEQKEFRLKVREVSGTDKLDGGLPVV